MKTLKRFFTLLFTSAALVLGIFAGFSTIQNSSNILYKEPNVAMAYSDVDRYPSGTPKHFYLTISSTWNHDAGSGYSRGQDAVGLIYVQLNNTGGFVPASDIAGSEVIDRTTNGSTYHILSVPLPDECTIIEFRTTVQHKTMGQEYGSDWTGQQSISQSSFGNNMLVVVSDYTSWNNQVSFQCFYNPDNQSYSGDTDQLFFVPSYTWCNNSYDSKSILPRIIIVYEDGDTFYSNPSGTTSDANTNKIYYYDNIPLKKPSAIVFNHNEEDSKWFTFDSTALNNWVDSSGNHNYNLFGMSSNNSPDQKDYSMYTDLVTLCDSKTFISGSFAESNFYANMAGMPKPKNILVGTGTGPFTLTYNIVKSDSFKYVIFDYIKNTSGYWGSSASWDLNSGNWCGYSASNITVYDENVGSDPVNIEDYLVSATDSKIKFLRGGEVTFRIQDNSSDATKYKLDIIFLNREQKTPSSSLDMPDCVRGSFNSQSTSEHTFCYNSVEDRYEVAIWMNTNDTFKYSKGSDYWSISTSEITLVDATIVNSGDYNDLKLTGSSGYYLVCFSIENASPDSTPSLSRTYKIIGGSTASSSKSSALELSRLVSKYQTCNVYPADLSACNNYYSTCTYSSKDSVMLSYTFYDYPLDPSRRTNDGYNYEGLTDADKTHLTNAYMKYQWIKWVGSGKVGPEPAPGLSAYQGLFGIESETSLFVIIIVVSSLSLLSITALSILLVKKRKRIDINQ